MLTLAWPVVMAELGWMAMGIVDTLMVAPLGAAAIGAVGLGHSVFFVPAIFGIGLLLGLDTLVSQAYGAGRLEDCRRWLVQGTLMALLLSPPLAALIWLITPQLPVIGIHPDVFERMAPYTNMVTWSMPALLVYTALRRYLQAVGVVRPVMIALVSANLVNIAANWLLIQGRLGFPALGVVGAAWATFFSRTYMVAILAWAVWSRDSRSPAGLIGPRASDRSGTVSTGWPCWACRRRSISPWKSVCSPRRLPWPGTLGPTDLAAHQIALNVCAVDLHGAPGHLLGRGGARGHGIGRGDPGVPRPRAGRRSVSPWPS